MSILSAEKNLMLAVRNILRSELSYTEQQCEVEYDETPPAIAGDTYIAVMTGGFKPGPRHSTSGGVSDLVYGIEVVVIKRAANTARDRTRNLFLTNTTNLATEIERIFSEVDFNYAITAAANTLIEAETSSTEEFIEPLKFVGVDRKPRIIGPEAFASTRTKQAGMARTIRFDGARRITLKA